MPAPENAPAPKPGGRTVTESLNSIDIYDESIGDNTVRPVRSPDLLRVRPPQRPSTQPPPEKEGERPDKSGPDSGAAES
jgi:hypothetical protein